MGSAESRVKPLGASLTAIVHRGLSTTAQSTNDAVGVATFNNASDVNYIQEAAGSIWVIRLSVIGLLGL